MTYDEGLAELDTILGDADDFTFTPEEKQRSLTQAWRDRYICIPVTNISNTYSNATQDYTVTSVPIPSELAYSTASTWSKPLPSEAWSFSGTTLTIDSDFRFIIPDGSTLRLKGRQKLTITDDIDNEQMIEYVLTLAHLNTLKLLGAKKTNRFIKNDTNMNEIIALRNTLALEATGLRQGLQTSYERI